MKSKVLAFIALSALALSPVLAQGKGAGQSGQRRQPANQGQVQKGTPDGQRTMAGERARIHATSQQQEQLRTCDQSADRLRQRARDMAKTASRTRFDANQARQQGQRLREQLQVMDREHERLMNGLSDDQKAAMQERIRQMTETRERVHSRIRELDQELNGQLNRERVADCARRTEQATKEWQEHFRHMKREMGNQPEH